MNISLEEVVKLDKDKELEKKFKNIRTGLKLNVAKFISENSSFEKQIESYSGLEEKKKTDESDTTNNQGEVVYDQLGNPIQPQASTQKKSTKKQPSFLDGLVEIGKLMDDTFNKLGDATEGVLAHKLSTISAIYVERIAIACQEAKLNNFPGHREKFSVDTSEEQEAKSVAPRTAFKSIKMFLDKYYFTFRQASVNAKARVIYTKLADFRENLLIFQYTLSKSLNKVGPDHSKEIAPFFKDAKLALLRLRKLMEAIDASNFGKTVKTIQDVCRENGIRIYAKNNPVVTTVNNPTKQGAVIPLKSIIDNYDTFMEPIHVAIVNYDKTKKEMLRRTPMGKDRSKMFWDISSSIYQYKDGMKSIIDGFSQGITPSDEDFRFFSHTVQAVIIPYINQSKGEVNQSFVINVNNLNTFFWKVTTKAIELGQVEKETLDEIIGIEVRVSQEDMNKYKENNKIQSEETEDE